jgi:hypothetical protein
VQSLPQPIKLANLQTELKKKRGELAELQLDAKAAAAASELDTAQVMLHLIVSHTLLFFVPHTCMQH